MPPPRFKLPANVPYKPYTTAPARGRRSAPLKSLPPLVSPVAIQSSLSGHQANIVSFVGVVRSFTPITESRGSDLSRTVALYVLPNDECVGHWDVRSHDSLPSIPALIFFPDVLMFPPVQRVGDIVICQAVNMRPYNGNWQALSTHHSRYLVVHSPDQEFPDEAFSDRAEFERHAQPPTFSQAVLKHGLSPDALESSDLAAQVLFFRAWWAYIRRNVGGDLKARLGQLPSVPVSTRQYRPLRLISDLREGEFVDVFVQIVENERSIEGPVDQVVLKFTVTDYTENNVLPYVPPDPQYPHRISGRRVLSCKAWGVRAQALQDCSPGTVVTLTNCTTKVLEGELVLILSADMQYPDKPHRRIHEPTSVEAGRMAQRRAAYLERVTTELAAIALDSPIPASPAQEPDAGLESPSPPRASPVATPAPAPPVVQAPLTRIKFPKQPITPIADVLNFAKPTWKFRLRAQITACAPKLLAALTQYFCAGCQHSQAATNASAAICTHCKDPLVPKDMVYNATLLLKDAAGDRLRVMVFGADALYFFGGLEPTNLHQDAVAYDSVLRRLGPAMPEIYTTAWAAHRPAPEAVPQLTVIAGPFIDLCIKSYEVTVDGRRQRRYSLFATELVS
ncbi:3-ketoacyl-CoA thiolase with broad chain length specificity [Tieghemiomyces parasiticus]|uniref:3-ketoacyl-CoA thiolase with broad chain length specificity n=1 Tax=Tieghemiomyces parasiticus TaxID=78921 RepID=A0A9W8AJM1_9FUNG|nr:3-ketoacyl-CoA thiolase with broad chain length specificity [Tieghemiomyces parasiticus]